MKLRTAESAMTAPSDARRSEMYGDSRRGERGSAGAPGTSRAASWGSRAGACIMSAPPRWDVRLGHYRQVVRLAGRGGGGDGRPLAAGTFVARSVLSGTDR